LKAKKESLIGTTVIISLIVLYFGINFVKGNNAFSLGYNTYVEYDQANDLQDGAPVMINGIKVGQVKNIEILKNKKSSILVELLLTTDHPIPNDTKAVLKSSGLMGGMMIDLELGASQELIKEDQKFIGTVEASALAGVTNAIGPMTGKIDVLMTQVDQTLAEFKTLAQNLNKFMAEANLNQKLNNVDALMLSLKKTSQIAQSTLQEIEQTTSSANQAIQDIEMKKLSQKLQNTLDESNKMIAKLNSDQGTLHKLTTDETLYNNLSKSTESLDKLLKDLKEHPKRYVHFSVFGRKDKK
jgi:phospholipid/cholesterol/gamma-HCH transport system substrate-binding protein